MSLTKLVSKMIGEKARWRAYQARTRRLPEAYRTAVEALERYLMYCGGVDGTGGAPMLEDLIDLFEQAAASETPIRDVVGDDPVEFVEAFVKSYPEGQWRVRERERLIRAIDAVTGRDPGTGGASR